MQHFLFNTSPSLDAYSMTKSACGRLKNQNFVDSLKQGCTMGLEVRRSQWEALVQPVDHMQSGCREQEANLLENKKQQIIWLLRN